MPTLTGKTGADALFGFIMKCCGTLKRYRPKLLAVITAAEAAGAITSDQAATIRGFVTTADALCDALRALAAYSGF
jgi:hypothetical protein